MDLNGEIDGLPNRAITLAAQPTGPTHSDFHCFTLNVAGGDGGGLFLFEFCGGWSRGCRSTSLRLTMCCVLLTR